jgi:hypothetical protein
MSTKYIAYQKPCEYYKYWTLVKRLASRFSKYNSKKWSLLQFKQPIRCFMRWKPFRQLLLWYIIDNNLFPFKLEIIGINQNTKFGLVIWYPMYNCVYVLHPMHIYPNVRFVITYWMSQSSNLQMCDRGCPTRFKMKWFATKKINVWQEAKDSKSSGGTCKSWGGGFSSQMPFSTSPHSSTS